MEQARFRELEIESLTAAKAGNISVVKTVLNEIQTENWRETVSDATRSHGEIPREPTVREDARQRLTELNDQLHSAFSALDVAAARPFRDEWKQKRQFAQLEDSDCTVEQVKPILECSKRRKIESQPTRERFQKPSTDIEQALRAEHVTLEDLSH